MENDRPTGAVSFDNRGRVALVSGGGGGIGKAICEAFLASGAQVVCLEINEASRAKTDERIEFVHGSTATEDDCRAAVDTAVEKFGGLDVLVNNASIQPTDSYVTVDEMSAELWERIVGVNLSGYTFLAKHALQVMKRQQSGVVVNIASAQGHRTARGVPAYGPIKAANLLQARQWGVEYARDGIRVVSVSPGAIYTDLVRETVAIQGGEERIANRHPLGRIGEPEEIANAVLWLSSASASFVTATDLEVDGGLGAFAAFADPYQMKDPQAD
ncbi:MAG: SDR family oxidoreductase [Pirellulaceae bacterium]|nr:SDR family oxidoreductase [Pirellulaceae bacterium]